jgi:hypothetical protein
MTRLYCPNSSLNLWMWNSRGTPQIFGSTGRLVHPVQRAAECCIWQCGGSSLVSSDEITGSAINPVADCHS